MIAYLELLLRWNKKINLTGIRDWESCVTRHFGESLYLGRWVGLSGRLLDIGSGAGFPGLSLKIIFPDLSVTLLEPVAKEGFLKEVARVCGMNLVEVRGERRRILLAAAAAGLRRGNGAGSGRSGGTYTACLALPETGGSFFLWLGHRQARKWATFRAGSKRWGESVCRAAGKGKFGGGRKRFEEVIWGEEAMPGGSPNRMCST